MWVACRGRPGPVWETGPGRYLRRMAAEPVTAEQYPDLSTYDLVSECGGRGQDVGRVIEENVACRSCDRADVTVYRLVSDT